MPNVSHTSANRASFLGDTMAGPSVCRVPMTDQGCWQRPQHIGAGMTLDFCCCSPFKTRSPGSPKCSVMDTQEQMMLNDASQPTKPATSLTFLRICAVRVSSLIALFQIAKTFQIHLFYTILTYMFLFICYDYPLYII